MEERLGTAQVFSLCSENVHVISVAEAVILLGVGLGEK